MLTVDQRAQLDVTGFARLPAVIDSTAADRMADIVWTSLAGRGIDRSDPGTWPGGFVTKLQKLRTGRAFDGFHTERTAAVVDEILGAGAWDIDQPWGPALLTFPQPGPWTVPHHTWHFDVPGRGDPLRPPVVRMFGYVTDVVPRGGGTLVVEGSHELVRRMVLAAPDHDAGSSADLRRKLAAAHPWFGALCREGGDRIRRFMTDGDVIDGVRVRVSELTASAGDVVVMQPWTMHNLSPNCASAPRFMVTTSIYRRM
jgi:hypothetical protein